MTKDIKPLGVKNYGSIGHFSFSKLGSGDHFICEGQEKIATEKFNNKRYDIIVTVKLDGSNVGVCRKDGEIIALGRAGYPAKSSPFKQHHLFAEWVEKNQDEFWALKEGERVVGEWLAQAHGMRYDLTNQQPFVLIDHFDADNKRTPYFYLLKTFDNFTTPEQLYMDIFPLSQNKLKGLITEYDLNPQHGELDPVEGAVYRVEHNGRVMFMAKYVRAGFKAGQYMEQEIFNKGFDHD